MLPLPSTDRRIAPPVLARQANAAETNSGGLLALPKLHGPLDARPAQQAQRADDEAPDDDHVLPRVALEAHGHHVLLLGVPADGQVVGEAEGAGALRARVGGGASGVGRRRAGERVQGAQEIGGGRRRVGGGAVFGPEAHDGAVAEAGAFAERWGCCKGL